jgi:hypothetical protein
MGIAVQAIHIAAHLTRRTGDPGSDPSGRTVMSSSGQSVWISMNRLVYRQTGERLLIRVPTDFLLGLGVAPQPSGVDVTVISHSTTGVQQNLALTNDQLPRYPPLFPCHRSKLPMS